MKTPREKYQNDPMYRALVDTFEAHLHRAQFTPSEIREAAMLACINYEMLRDAAQLHRHRLGWRDGPEEMSDLSSSGSP